MAQITGVEKANTAVGKGINLLRATRLDSDQVSTYDIFDMSKIPVESMTINRVEVDVHTENSLVELAKSLSISAGVEAKYMAFSASVKTDYQSSYESSTEKAYTRVVAYVKKKRHYLSNDTTCKRYITTEFKNDLMGNMSPERFFNKYGTHFVREAGMGGALTMNLITNKEQSESKESLKIAIEASYGDIVSGSCTTEQKNSIKKIMSRSTFKCYVDGGKNVSSLNMNNLFTEYPAWVKSVDDNPAKWEFCFVPSDNSLVPIWELGATGNRRKELIAYYETEAAKLKSVLSNVEYFVGEIRIYNESRRQNAKVEQKGWKLVDQDLNEGAKGNFIYLSYRPMTKADLDKAKMSPITNIMLVMSDKKMTWTSPKRLYDGNGRSALYYRIDSDLNKNAGGKYIYLCYTRDTVYPPLVAIDAYKDNNRPTNGEWNTVTWENSHSIADANRGAGGRYIYILQKPRC